MRIGRLALVAGLAIWTIQFARTPLSSDAMDSFLHLPDLMFHEAGHVIFSLFGRFMTVLGGSLMQCLVPVIAAIAFVRQEEPFSAAICAWWGGQNLIDLAPYIADARALQLVLLGGHTGAEVEGHDWEFILTRLRATHLDQQDRHHGLCDRPADHDRLAGLGRDLSRPPSRQRRAHAAGTDGVVQQGGEAPLAASPGSSAGITLTPTCSVWSRPPSRTPRSGLTSP